MSEETINFLLVLSKILLAATILVAIIVWLISRKIGRGPM